MNHKILVCYKSVTGFTQRYAEIIAAEINGTLMSFQNVTAEILADYDTIVFGSRFHAGTVDGLKQAKALFSKCRGKKWILFATGATPNTAEETIQEAWKKNLSPDELQNIPHFYMQSGLCYERMPLQDRLMMRVFAAVLWWKKPKTAYEKELAQAVASSFDKSSPAYAEPLLALLRTTSPQKA